MSNTANALTSHLPYSLEDYEIFSFAARKRLAIQSFHLPVLSVWDLILHIDTQYYSQPSYLFCITK